MVARGRGTKKGRKTNGLPSGTSRECPNGLHLHAFHHLRHNLTANLPADFPLHAADLALRATDLPLDLAYDAADFALRATDFPLGFPLRLGLGFPLSRHNWFLPFMAGGVMPPALLVPTDGTFTHLSIACQH